MDNKKALPATSGLASVGVWLVGHFTGILEVRLPSRPLLNPARPPSRRALTAMRGRARLDRVATTGQDTCEAIREEKI